MFIEFLIVAKLNDCICAHLMYIMSRAFHCFRKETGHITTENNVYLAYTDLQMEALSEQKVDGHCADILSTETDITDYTSSQNSLAFLDFGYTAIIPQSFNIKVFHIAMRISS